MFTRYILVAVSLLTVLAISSCAGGGTNPTSVNPLTDTVRTDQWAPGDPQTFPIIAGQHFTAGEVTITNGTDFIYFDVTMFGDWVLTEVHIQVGTDDSDFPRNPSGRLIPGHFDFAEDFNPGVTTHTFAYPYDVDMGGPYMFSFHCNVQRPGQEETGWGGTCDGSWSKGYTCDNTWSQCVDDVQLPGCTGDYHATYYYPGTLGSYWNVLLTDFPVGFDLYNGLWPGWCVQKTVYAYSGYPYPICAYSTYADENELPALLQAIHWDKVNYIINHKGSASVMQIQTAIWYYTLNGAGYTPGADPVVDALIAAAEANGNGFAPEDGELMGIVLYAGPNVQAIFVELPVICVE